MPKQFKIVGPDGAEIYLSDTAVRFLLDLNSDGVKKIEDTVEFVQQMKTAGRLTKWTFGAFVGVVGFVSAVIAIVKNLAGGSH